MNANHPHANESRRRTRVDDLPMFATVEPQKLHIVSSASVQSYEAVAPSLSERRTAIVALLRERGPMTCREIAEALHVPMHFVSGRVTELKALGRVRNRIEHGGIMRRGNGNVVELTIADFMR